MWQARNPPMLHVTNRRVVIGCDGGGGGRCRSAPHNVIVSYATQKPNMMVVLKCHVRVLIKQSFSFYCIDIRFLCVCVCLISNGTFAFYRWLRATIKINLYDAISVEWVGWNCSVCRKKKLTRTHNIITEYTMHLWCVNVCTVCTLGISLLNRR